MKSQKHLFSLQPNIHYLNCAYKAPLLKAAEEACKETLIRERNPFNIEPIDFFTTNEKVRAMFAKLIGSEAKNIAIMPSTSYGFASVLGNIRGKENGNALTLQDEFPSGYFSLQRWCRENENELRIAKPGSGNIQGESWNEDILNQIDEQTSVVLMSSVHWMNGLRFDLKKIGQRCREVGAKFIVDGTQSVGAIPMDVHSNYIDALVGATYKWLFGTYSIALAYISDEFENGQPLEESWMNRVNSKDFTQLTSYSDEYNPGAGKYNVGEKSNLIAMPILKESLKQILEWGPGNIQAYCSNLIQPLLEYLREIGVELEGKEYFSNHIFALSLPDNMDEELLKANLAKNNIYISIRGGKLRVSVNVFNEEADIIKLISVMEQTMAG